MPRTVSVAITANTSGFTAGMSRVSSSAKSAADSVKGTFASGFDKIGKNAHHIDGLSSGLGKLGIVAGIGVGAAVRAFAQFDSAMSGVAATGSDARQNLDALRDAAIKAGADTKYSASEAAGGIEALAKAGVTAKDTLGGGLSGALNLAAAGNLGVAESAEVAASALTQFGLSGSDIPHVADLLAQAAGTAQGEVSDMAEALNNSGVAANSFGLTIDDTAKVLSLFAKSGIVGAEAGTLLKSSLSNLFAPTGTAAKELDRLGISAYDAAGQVKPVSTVMQQLQDKLGGLDAASRNNSLARIFGKETLQGGVILTQAGAQGLSDMATEFGKFGSAADVARLKMDNLSGDLEQLKGSFETALIGLGEGGSGPLRDLVQNLTDGVNAFNDLGDGSKSAILTIAGSVAVLALSAGGIGKIAVAASEAKTAMQALGISAKAAGIATLGVTAGIGLAALAFSHYAASAAASRGRVDDFTSALQSQTDAISTNVTAVAAKQLQDAGGLAAASRLGIGLDKVTAAATGNQAALDEVYATIQRNIDAGGEQFASVDQLQAANDANDLARALGITAEEYQKAVTKAGEFAEATSGTGSAAASAADQAAQHASDLQEEAAAFQAAIDKAYAYSNALLSLSGSQIGVEAAIDGAASAAKENGKNLDISTAKGRANQSALNAIAAATTNYTKALTEQGAPAEKIVAANERGRNAFIKNAVSMGKSSAAAKRLAADLFPLSKDITAQVVVKGAKVSEGEAKSLNKALRDIPAEQRAKIVTIANTKGAKAAKQAIEEVKDKKVIARAEGNPKGAKEVAAAMRALKDRLVKATARGDKAGADRVRSAMNALKSKTVTAGTRADTSGVRSAQAAINGFSGKTVYVTIKERKIKSDGGGRANGGYISGPGGPTEDLIPAMLSNGEFVIRAAAVKAIGIDQLHALNAKGYATGGPVGFAKGGEATIVKVIQLQDRVEEARTYAERAKAEKDLAKATKKLTETQTAAIESVKSFAASLVDPYRSKSTDVDDVLEALRSGATDINRFGKQVRDLRKAGLDESVIKNITDQGAINGSELASQILGGGKALVDALNKANGNLEKAANSIGFSTIGLKGYAAGGYLSGAGTGTSDSISARLSNGEYVINARSTAEHRPLLDAINFGRATVDHRFVPAYATGGYVPRPSSIGPQQIDNSVYLNGVIGDPDRWLRKARDQQHDLVVMGLR